MISHSPSAISLGYAFRVILEELQLLDLFLSSNDVIARFRPLYISLETASKGVEFNKADALAFVTNQKISLAKRDVLKSAGKVPIELFHLERITVILDKPEMVGVRKQFLGIDYDEANLVLLGGEGGKDFSAGGGGGGALGFAAQGGDGGPGGNIILDGHPGEVPGAGGRRGRSYR
jgi:hypothetical protein